MALLSLVSHSEHSKDEKSTAIEKDAKLMASSMANVRDEPSLGTLSGATSLEQLKD